MEHAPTPWKLCGSDRGGCKCGQIWCDDYPIAVVTHGEWGDTYPSVRLVNSEGEPCDPGYIGVLVEPYTAMIPYGNVSHDLAIANARFIVRACNSHEQLLEALTNLVTRIDHNGGIGEYTGGPLFVMKAARAAIRTATGVGDA